MTPANVAWQRPVRFDASGNSNQLVISINTRSASLATLLAQSAAPLPLDSPQAAERAFVQIVDVQKNRALLEALGSPEASRFVITQDRLSEDALRDLEPNDPAVRLHRFILLRYSSVDAAKSALRRLAISDWADTLSMDRAIRLSSQPTDQFYLKPSLPTAVNYQWGLHAMQFSGAWARTRGHAYVGVLDAPIWRWTVNFLNDYGSITNTDLTANFRRQFASVSQEIQDASYWIGSDWTLSAPHGLILSTFH